MKTSQIERMEGIGKKDKYSSEPSIITDFLMIGSYDNARDPSIIQKYNIKGLFFFFEKLIVH